MKRSTLVMICSLITVALVSSGCEKKSSGRSSKRNDTKETTGTSEYSWQIPHAKVLPEGDLEWAPEPFEYSPGPTIRYIDFENGNDSNAGASKDAPWKHHPWDPESSGKAKAHNGPTTYVFKQGVIYRGILRPNESGEPGNPIRLTRDPGWGEGEACIYGSERIIDGWEQGVLHPKIPHAEKVWYRDLDFAPRCLWWISEDSISRIALARDPNWTEPDPQDPMSEWYTWDQPGWWTDTNYMVIHGKKYHLGIDSSVLTGTADDYMDGTVWTEWGIVMGSPYPTRIRGYDRERKAIAFGGPWVWFGSEKIITDNRYYLEDMPRFLDSPGEFWFELKENGGRLYLRLPDDLDPNDRILEAGKHINIIDMNDISHIEITGLTFRFTDIHWEYDIPQWAHPDLKAGVVRMEGSGEDLVLSHNNFEHVHLPIRITAPEKGRIRSLRITDNEIHHTDHGGITLRNANRPESERGVIVDAQVLRNRLEHIGWRNLAGAHGHALTVNSLTAHVAGNMLYRTGGWGISVSGGWLHDGADNPLGRYSIHHNRVKDCLLKSCDWGAFYITSHGGPTYIYNNVAINPVGQMNWSGKRLGYAYYMDGGYKGYLFNNIAAGIDHKTPELANAAALQSMISFQNTYFNNTIFNFKTGSNRQAPQGSREKYLGNIFTTIHELVFRHAKPANSPDAANAAHLPKEDAKYLYETNAYNDNVLFDTDSSIIGVFESNGMPYRTLDAFIASLEERHALQSTVGIMADTAPVQNPKKGDFRPSPHSPAVERGAKVFVPWGLYGMVGEWNFTVNNENPADILDEHWYQTPYYAERSMYRKTPRYNLEGINITSANYITGPLENWTKGVLKLNGTDQYAVLSFADMTREFTYEVKRGKKKQVRTASGKDLRSPAIDTSNLLVEVYFNTEDDDGGVLVQKKGSAGYGLSLTASGNLVFGVVSARGKVTLTSKAKLNDGQWHHILCELDRSQQKVRMYIDGNHPIESKGIGPDESLWDKSDLYVGGIPDGECLSASIEFLRICRGTLEDARTTIDELYTWQFDGPQFRDFTGRPPVGRRDAGAIEYIE